MKKKIVVLIPILLSIIFISSFDFALADSGANFDREQIGERTFKSIIYPYYRIMDNNQWVNFIETETDDLIRFESGQISFEYNKLSCDFRLYKAGKIEAPPVIESYSHVLKIDGVENPTTCFITSKIKDENGLHITVQDNGFQTVYDLSFTGILEWTYNLQNNEGKNSLYKFSETCYNCQPKTIKGDVIEYDDYFYDAKNNQHNTLSAIKIMNNSLVVDFEKRLNDKEVFSIDPTFTSNNPTVDGYIYDNSNNDSCDGASLVKNTADAVIGSEVYATSNAFDCLRSFVEWDISSISDTSTITDTDFKFQLVTATNARNCDYVGMSASPSSATNSEIWTSISSDTVLVNNDATCTSTGTNKNIDLGSAGDTYVTNHLSSNWFGLGIKADDESQNSSDHIMFINAEETASTPDPTLEIVYTTSSLPNPVNDLTANTISSTRIDLDWSQPNLNGGTLQGYQINRTSPYGNPNTILVNNSGTNTEYSNTGLTISTQYSYRVGAWTQYGINAGGNIANATTNSGNVPDAPTLGVISLSETSLRFTSVAGASPGDGTISWYGLRCELNNAGGWLTTVSNSTIPSNRIYEYLGLIFGDSVTCQWRDGSEYGWSDWSNNATGQTESSIIESPRAPGSNPLYKVIEWVDSQGGLYFGLSIIPLAVMLIGLLATPKTTHIFTLAMLFVMGILHGSGIYAYPDWFWAMSILLGMVLILGRREK